MATRKLEIVISAKNLASGELDKVSASAEETTSTFGSVKKSAIAVAAALTTLAIGLTKVFNTITQFNKGLATIATLIPNNRARIEEMRSDIQALSIQMGKTTEDLTAGMFQVVSAFGDGAESTERLRIVASAATAGMATTTESLNLLSAVTKGYGDTSAEALQKVADLAFMTNKLGQTTFPELAASMGRVVPLASTLNASQEELFATFATLTGVTGGAAEVSTQMAGVLQGLLKPTAQMSATLKELGIDNVSATIAQDGLVQTLKNAIATTDGSSKAVATLFGSVEALNAVLALTGSQADVFNNKFEEMKNASGAATQAFQDMTQGVNKTGFEFDQMNAKMSVATQFLGEKLQPTFSFFIKSAVVGIKGIVFAIEVVNQSWNVFETIASGAIHTVAMALSGLFTALRLLLKPLDQIAEWNSQITGMANPFDAIEESLDIFVKRSGDVLKENADDIATTHLEYRKFEDTLDGVINKVNEVKTEAIVPPVSVTPEITEPVASFGEVDSEGIPVTREELLATQMENEVAKIEQQKLIDEMKLDTLASFHERELEMAIAHGASLSEQERIKTQQSMEFAEQERLFKQQTMASQFGATSNFLQNIFTATGSSNKKLFKLMQGFAIGEAIINAYAGANQALASLPFPANIAGAAVALATGFANVAAIKSQKTGGSAGGGTISAGGASLPKRSGGGSTAQGVPTRLDREREAEKKQDVTINIHSATGDVPQETIDKIMDGINIAGATRNTKINNEAIG